MDTFTMRELSSIPLVSSMAFHPTEPIIVTGGTNGAVKLHRMSLDTMTVTSVSTLPSHKDTVLSVAFHPLGSYFVTGSSDFDTSAKMWQLSPDGATAKCVTIIYPHSRAVKSVAFHPREPIIATGSYGTASRVWRISIHAASPIPTPFFTLASKYDWIRSIAFDPTGRFLATCSSDLTTKIWRVQIDGNIDQYPIAFLSGNSFNVTTVAFDSTGCFLATGDIHGMIELWRVQPDDDTNWTSVAILSGHSSFVNSIAFYPDGLFLVTGSDDKTVKIWMLFSNKSRAKCIHTVKYRIKVKQVQFNPLGNILAIVLYDGSLIFYDCSALTDTSMRLKLLATQGTAGLLAKRLYTHPGMLFNPKALQHTTDKVNDDENLALHRSLVTSGEAQAKARENLQKQNPSGSGGRISQRKRKINKRNSYRR